ncbi:hypothetical protein BRARA_D01147, partial [Brassica rapa]
EATSLEKLSLEHCISLVELSSSIRNLHKLEELNMRRCKKLGLFPTNIKLASLDYRTFPDISSNIKHLGVRNTKIKDVSALSVAERWLRLGTLYIGSKSLKRLTHVPECVRGLDLSDGDIKNIPDCIIGLPRLHYLIIKKCRKLVSLQGLPTSLRNLDADDCVSLKSVCFSFYESKAAYITLGDCKYEETRRVIMQQWDYKCVWLPDKEVPPEFTHRAKGNSITIPKRTFSAFSRVMACLLLSPLKELTVPSKNLYLLRCKGGYPPPPLLTEHMFVIFGALFKEHTCLELEATLREIQFEFSCNSEISRIIECGVQ